MQKNRHSTRSLIAFLVTWSFLVLTLTGIVLYVVPEGRVAYWVHWSLAGMGKDQWAWVHMMFGGLFIVTGIIHLYFNWKPFKKYFAERVRGHLKLKRELVIATAATIAVAVLAALNLPPASWIITLNGWVKDAWVTAPELEPPYGHAEETSLAGLARRMDIDLPSAMDELRRNGVRFDSERDSLETIAQANNMTPMAVYEYISKYQKLPETPEVDITPEEIEARYAGTGLGRKTLAEICQSTGVDLQTGLAKLAQAGIPAKPDDNARELADKHDLSPIDLLKIMMLR